MKLEISLKTTRNLSGAPCWPPRGLIWTHCNTGSATRAFGSELELKIALRCFRDVFLSFCSENPLQKSLIDMRSRICCHGDDVGEDEVVGRMS